MRVILRENVSSLGRIGDIVNVSNGYARNFLLPRKLVVVADGANLKELEHHQRVLEKRRLKDKENSEAIAQAISKKSLSFSRKVGKNEKLFGSVSSQDIEKALSELGFEVEKTQIILPENIKSLGDHAVKIRLRSDVEAEIRVTVEGEAADDKEASSAE